MDSSLNIDMRQNDYTIIGDGILENMNFKPEDITLVFKYVSIISIKTQ